ncbi:hypothetical protein ABIE45_000425 [Methylobacterium sp. OAE515]|uniref:hypothetical protein n=1 Tax=Methylobacterium sp. OAE515 TaxID=2817895 RepID=UPI0017892B34
MQADFRNPTLFAQVERVSMRASAGRFRLSKRVETLTKDHGSWFGGGHPTLVLILRCGAAASKEGSSRPRDP